MAELTITGLSDELYKLLRESATESGRSMSAEATILLERALYQRLQDEDVLHERAARLRERTHVYLTSDDIITAVEEGRP